MLAFRKGIGKAWWNGVNDGQSVPQESSRGVRDAAEAPLSSGRAKKRGTRSMLMSVKCLYFPLMIAANIQ